ncbi:MAG: ABC transporter permease [Acidimicrobiales bacterium]
MRSNRLRFALTTFSVLLGVSFVVASFVLTDGLRSTFESISTDSYSDVDAQVLARSDFDEVAFEDRPIDESWLDVVAAVDGVESVNPNAETLKIVPTTASGEPVTTTGAPIISVSWDGSTLSSLTLVEGSVPGPGEFALDQGTAEREGMVVGQTYDLIGIDGPEPFTLSGINRFGEENTLAGAVLMSFQLDEVQRLNGSEGLLQSIDVRAAADVEPAELIRRLEAALPNNIQAVGSEVLIEADQEDFGVFVDIFGNILLAFALVAVFVSTFIIANTFNILLGQRVRQLSLLRALGASSRQIRFGAMFEALIVGVAASILGLAGGVGLAFGVAALMDALGFTLPSIDIIISTRTVVAALVVGVGVTLVAALSPARRASGISPMAGLRAGFKFGSGEGTRRTIIAIILAIVGGSAMAYGLLGGTDNTGLLLTVLGLGAVLVFVSISMFSPLFSTPSASFLGRPLEHLPSNKITGHMARENAAKNNKRTASTAAGLMIGLALVAMATVVATSLKASFRAEMGSTVTSDFLVTAPNGGTFSNRLADQVAALPEFQEVSAVRYGNARIGGSEHQVAATDLTLLEDLLAVGVTSGDPAQAADAQHVLIHTDVAEDRGLAVGDQLPIQFAAVGTRSLKVGAIYDNPFLIGDYIIDLAGWDENFSSQDDAVLSAKLAPGVNETAGGAALEPLATAFPQLDFETNAQFRDRIEGQLDSFLIIINVFLGLAIIIALLGITNTMALSVLERTREIGLMRAIGMTRRQTRSLIRLEAGVVSVFGALLGVLVGIAFGWIAVLAIPSDFIDRLSIPFATLAVYVVIAALAGLVSASLPARRASRLNILDSIAEL